MLTVPQINAKEAHKSDNQSHSREEKISRISAKLIIESYSGISLLNMFRFNLFYCLLLFALNDRIFCQLSSGTAMTVLGLSS